MPLSLSPEVSAEGLLEALISLQHDIRLREVLGPRPLEKLALEVAQGRLLLGPASGAQLTPEACGVVEDRLREICWPLTTPPGSPPSHTAARGSPNRNADPRPHLVAARAHLDAGNPGRALEVVEAALPRWPTSAEMRIYHALALSALGRAPEAVRAYEEAARLDPRSAFAHTGAAELLAGLGRWGEALQHAQAALELDPADTLCWRVAALAYEAEGRYHEAVAAMRQALSIDPHLHDGKRELERMERELAEDVQVTLEPAGESEPGPIEVTLEEGEASGLPQGPGAVEVGPVVDARWGVAARTREAGSDRQCPTCHAPNPPQVSFCVRCGDRLQASPSER